MLDIGSDILKGSSKVLDKTTKSLGNVLGDTGSSPFSDNKTSSSKTSLSKNVEDFFEKGVPKVFDDIEKNINGTMKSLFSLGLSFDKNFNGFDLANKKLKGKGENVNFRVKSIANEDTDKDFEDTKDEEKKINKKMEELKSLLIEKDKHLNNYEMFNKKPKGSKIESFFDKLEKKDVQSIKKIKKEIIEEFEVKIAIYVNSKNKEYQDLKKEKDTNQEKIKKSKKNVDILKDNKTQLRNYIINSVEKNIDKSVSSLLEKNGETTISNTIHKMKDLITTKVDEDIKLIPSYLNIKK